jgi:hypothetical protein
VRSFLTAIEIAVEGFAARGTYIRVVNDALRRYRIDRPVRVTSWPPRGSGRGGGDALARSAALLQALEVDTCRLAGHFPAFEEAAVTWQAGQHQPDDLAALIVAHDVLVHSAGRQWSFASPVETERRLDARRQAASGLARRVSDRAPVHVDIWLLAPPDQRVADRHCRCTPENGKPTRAEVGPG